MKQVDPAVEPFTELRPGIRRLIAPNPSMMTGPGTNTYLLGEEEVAVLDPGPLIDSHIERIVELADAPIGWILVTHTHPDHSPAANVLAQITGAEVFGRTAPEGPHQDTTVPLGWFCNDAEKLEIDEFDMTVFHTPGHASNHVCYLHEESNWLFTGDHVVDGSTVVIDPPDGNMKHYIESLQRIRRLECAAIAPGHGEIIHDPGRVIDWIIDHRLGREAKVVAALQANPGLTTSELVPFVYTDVNERLHALAERSLLAHLIKLEEEARASQEAGRWDLLPNHA
jgi:glyoxylase-like metal-dependent hydrolase (beta-lactamase superfamily II)